MRPFPFLPVAAAASSQADSLRVCWDSECNQQVAEAGRVFLGGLTGTLKALQRRLIPGNPKEASYNFDNIQGFILGVLYQPGNDWLPRMSCPRPLSCNPFKELATW